MSLSVVDIMNVEKEKAMARYQRFIKIANIATTLELCFAVIFLSWSISRSSAYFPAAVQLCRFILRRLCTLVANHHFVFLLGNLIVVTLLLKSGNSATKNRPIVSPETADAEENYLIRRFLPTEEASVILPMKTEVRRSRRTRSEEFEVEMTEKIELRRSETEPRRKSESSAEESAGKRWMQVEDLSNEEFQRKVEAFIEQQQRFLREECTINYSLSASETLN